MTILLACILAGVGVEAAALLAWHRRTGRGLGAASLLPNLAAGAALLLGMICLAAGAGWVWVCACLAGALVGHVLDLRRRWGSPARLR